MPTQYTVKFRIPKAVAAALNYGQSEMLRVISTTKGAHNPFDIAGWCRALRISAQVFDGEKLAYKITSNGSVRLQS